MSNRETMEQLEHRMLAAERLVPVGCGIRHVKSGGEYLVTGHAVRVGDLALMVQYSPRHNTGVVFSREVAAIRAKFVRCDGEEWSEVSDE